MQQLFNSIKKSISAFREAISSNEKDYTSGSINDAIFVLSIPVVIEMLGEGLFAIVDIAFVSRVSVNAISTVGLTESMMFIVYSIAIGLSMAATAVVSRRVGEKDQDGASSSTLQAIIIAITVGLLIGGFGFIYAEEILYLMDATPEVVDEGLGYTKILFASNVIVMLLFIINGAFRGAGDSAIAMRVLLIANGLNIILDPIFIFGFGPIPALGVKGAAIATTIGRGIAVLIQFAYLFGGMSRIKLLTKKIKVQFDIIGNLLKISLGGIGQFLVESASWIVLIRILSGLGTEYVAGFTIGFRIIAFTLLPSWGLAQAAAALVGQNLGAQKPDRAETSVVRSAIFNTVFLLLVSIVFYLGAGFIVKEWFTEEPKIVELASLTLKVICLGYVFFAFGMVVSQAFNGAGDTRTPTIINIVCFWAVQLPLAYLLTQYFDMGMMGVLICIAFSHSIHAVISVAVFRKGNWKHIRV